MCTPKRGLFLIYTYQLTDGSILAISCVGNMPLDSATMNIQVLGDDVANLSSQLLLSCL